MSDIQTTVQAMLIRALVQRHIFCPISGKVLDERTCTVVLDSDGDPCIVLDPGVDTSAIEDSNVYSIMER